MKLISKRTISGLLCCVILGIQLIGIGNISIGAPFFSDGYPYVVSPMGGTPDPKGT